MLVEDILNINKPIEIIVKKIKKNHILYENRYKN